MARRSLLLAILLSLPSPGQADELARPAGSRLELHADLQNLFLLRNDSDLDRTAPFYDADGQTVGAFATIFRPRATLRIFENLQITYEVELGLNYWSKQNPDQQSPLAPDVFVLKHREIFASGELRDGGFGFKAGYSYFRDPTGLFLAHWIGNGQAWAAFGPRERRSRVGIFLGQLPDQSTEGWEIRENNFKRDIWVFGANAELAPRAELRISAAVSGLVDTHLVGQMRALVSPSLRLAFERDGFSAFLEAALQGGVLEQQALGGDDQRLLAWAAQSGATIVFPRAHLELTGNLLLLSPDDAHEGNRWQHAFLYSGKSRSATLILTEDEIRDWYDNLDERFGVYQGGLFQNRAGLVVADLKASFAPLPWLRPSLILGVGATLKGQNSLGERWIGFEADLVLELRANEHLSTQLVVGTLIPGKAGAALINRIDRYATDPILMGEASLMVRY
jgi:hypothetical protein